MTESQFTTRYALITIMVLTIMVFVVLAQKLLDDKINNEHKCIITNVVSDSVRTLTIVCKPDSIEFVFDKNGNAAIKVVGLDSVQSNVDRKVSFNKNDAD